MLSAGPEETVAAVAVPSLAQLIRLTDDVGIIQHATFDIPNRETGYCTDDVARACITAFDAQQDYPELAERLQVIYLSFLHHAQMPDGRFHNFMSYGRQWLDETGDEDAVGRAVWALGYGERYALTDHRRAFCKTLVDRAVGGARLPALHSMSYAALGISRSYLARGAGDTELRILLRETGDELVEALNREHRDDWHWFEHHLTYDSARLPEALMAIGLALETPAFVQGALRALDFYLQTVFETDIFTPIGSDGWYCRDGKRARHPQQPIEAAATIDALSLAFAITQESKYHHYAQCAYAWFSGRNSAAQTLLREGGCADGIDEHSVNRNMGAESTISHISAAYGLRNFGRAL